MSLRTLAVTGLTRMALTHRVAVSEWVDHRPPPNTPWCPVFSDALEVAR